VRTAKDILPMPLAREEAAQQAQTHNDTTPSGEGRTRSISAPPGATKASRLTKLAKEREGEKPLKDKEEERMNEKTETRLAMRTRAPSQILPDSRTKKIFVSPSRYRGSRKESRNLTHING
jgi:hypothetical protein